MFVVLHREPGSPSWEEAEDLENMLMSGLHKSSTDDNKYKQGT